MSLSGCASDSGSLGSECRKQDTVSGRSSLRLRHHERCGAAVRARTEGGTWAAPYAAVSLHGIGVVVSVHVDTGDTHGCHFYDTDPASKEQAIGLRHGGLTHRGLARVADDPGPPSSGR